MSVAECIKYTVFKQTGPFNPVELLAATDTSFFKHQLVSQKLPDGQTEFHIPKEMVCSFHCSADFLYLRLRWDR